MQIISITKQQISIVNRHTTLICSPDNLKEIWLFNCEEGCQHNLREYRIKINQISKIIITSLNIYNISGLLGLLSSLSLINRNKDIHIYSPQGLDIYLKLGKRYSQTNFRYNLYFHTLQTGLTINHRLYQIYTYVYKTKFEFSIVSKEKFGKFKLVKAKDFKLIEGPLYGKLKRGGDFILPDGLVLNNKQFTDKNISGTKISFIYDRYSQRNSIEISNKGQILL